MRQICEKEAKTKTFSKEGLAREQKIDPKELAKNTSREWLQKAVSTLNTQIESFDADLERLAAGKGEDNHHTCYQASERRFAVRMNHASSP